MKFNFDKKTNDFLKIITKNAQIQKIRVFFVGGIVRDKLLNLEENSNHDIDLILDKSAISFCKKLPKEIKIKSIHEAFDTAKVEFKGKIFDIATTREECYISSGALPSIIKTGVPLEIDVKRRDFSINSMYLELKLKNDEIEYSFIDLVNGKDDIEKKLLKVLHKNSYIDDPTRILRGINFKFRFGFDFSKENKILIQDYIQNFSSYENENFSKDRFLGVLEHILKSEKNKEIFKEIVEKNIYKIYFKNEIKVDFKKIDEVIRKFELNSEEKKDFYIDILKNKEENIEELTQESEIKKYFSKYSNSKLAYFFYKTENKNIEKYLKIKDIKLFINGNDLIKLGFKGRKIGIILDKMFDEKSKNKEIFSSKEEELDFVKKNFS